MLKRTLKAVWYGSVFAVSMTLTAAYAIQITGRDTSLARSIAQSGISAMSTDNAITASTTQSLVGAYQLTAGVNTVTTANANDAIKLPSLAIPNGPTNMDASYNIIILNATAVNITVYPAESTTSIYVGGSTGGAGALYTMATRRQLDCWSVSTGTWYCTVG
jgi:hypothetical protein